MANYYENKETTISEDKDGNQTITTKTTSKKADIYNEPDYIKIYTDMWCDFNKIPERWRTLFLQLAIRMSYADSSTSMSIKQSQTVVVYGKTTNDILTACGWTDKSNLRKGLKALCDCGAIKHTEWRATYQINPSYAGRGEWKYNPKLKRGGVENIISLFNLKDKTVDTKFIWADDGKQSDINTMYRQGLGTSSKDNTILRETKIKKITAEEFAAEVNAL